MGRSIIYNKKEYESVADLARSLKFTDRGYKKLAYTIKKCNGDVDLAVAEVLSKINARPKKEEVDQEEPIKNDNCEREEEMCCDCNSFNTIQSKNQIPTYYHISHPFTLVSMLKEMHVDKVNLIDFENVCNRPDILEPIIKENTVNVFFYNAMKYSDKFYQCTKNSSSLNFQVLTFEVADQLVDHMIVFYLGVLNAHLDIKYHIISKDIGFYRFIENLNFNNIDCVGVNYIQDKDTRYKYCVCKFITESKIKNRPLLTVSETKELFKSFFKYNPSEKDINDLIKNLERYELIEYVNKNSFKWIKFKIDEITDFFNIYKP